jgi:hypothetical protein
VEVVGNYLKASFPNRISVNIWSNRKRKDQVEVVRVIWQYHRFDINDPAGLDRMMRLGARRGLCI